MSRRGGRRCAWIPPTRSSSRGSGSGDRQGEHIGFATITAGQWVTAVLAGLVGLGLTGAATNRATNAPAPMPIPPQAAQPATSAGTA